MEGASMANGRRTTVEEVFRDFRARRASMVKALTTDAKKFFEQCDPEKENLCLYGFPNETWEVNLPGEEVPPELPEPSLGINFARDGMDEKDWIALVAVHSDAWLMSVAFFFASRFGFDKDERRRLFTMINGMPTICEVVTGTIKKLPKEKIPNSKSTSKSGSKPPRKSELQSKMAAPPLKEEDSDGGEEDDDEEGTGKTLCGECGGYDTDKFWICCDICEVWFHGRCVNITPARAEHIKQYKCPACSGNKRGRA